MDHEWEEPEDDLKDAPPTGFGKLARTIGSRTTDLLAVAILAMGCLAVAGKVTRWWAQSPAVRLPSSEWQADSLANLVDQGVSLEFGGMDFCIHHQILNGTADTIGSQLEELAIEQLPHVSKSPTVPTKAEEKLLEQLSQVPISRTLPSGESLYRIGVELPLVILTKNLSAERLPVPRVVCWARAFPRSANRWMMFLFYPTDRAKGTVNDSGTITFPDDFKTIQTICTAEGQRWQAIQGTGSILESQHRLEQCFVEQGLQLVRGWSQTKEHGVATFENPKTQQRAEAWIQESRKGITEVMIFFHATP